MSGNDGRGSTGTLGGDWMGGFGGDWMGGFGCGFGGAAEWALHSTMIVHMVRVTIPTMAGTTTLHGEVGRSGLVYSGVYSLLGILGAERYDGGGDSLRC
ncbi:hypothetical protein BD626DRAFT_521875, partial [Schizophyllum amplum]